MQRRDNSDVPALTGDGHAGRPPRPRLAAAELGALPEPRPVVLRMVHNPEWNSLSQPVITAKPVKVGDAFPGGWVIAKVTRRKGVEHIWLARADRRRP